DQRGDDGVALGGAAGAGAEADRRHRPDAGERAVPAHAAGASAEVDGRAPRRRGAQRGAGALPPQPAARGPAQPGLDGTPNAREDPARMTIPLFRPPAPPMFQQGRRGRRLVIAFAVCLALWTVALLVPVPHKAAEAVLGSPSRMFYVGKALH